MSIRPARRVADLERTLIRRIFDGAPADAINLGLGQPDLPTPAEVSLAGVEAIATGRTGYTATPGDGELREAIAASYAPAVEGPEQVVVTVGTQQAMFAAVAALCDPGDELLYPEPGYPAYPVVARLLGVTPRVYRLKPAAGFRLDAGELLQQLTPRTRAVILCSPANPTGAVHTDAALDALTAELERREIPWISDEVYSGFVFDGELPVPRSRTPAAGLTISGLSKNMSMTGWRIGWVAGPREILARITAVHQSLVTCACSVSQRAALAAFTAEGRRAAARYREIFHGRRALMAAALQRLPQVKFSLPDGAFYFFVDVSAHGSSLELARRILERRKVICIPGEAFGPAGRGYLRLSFAAAEEEIERGVRAIGKELAGD